MEACARPRAGDSVGLSAGCSSCLPPTLGESWLQRTESPLTLLATEVITPQSLSAGQQIFQLSGPAFFLATAPLVSQVGVWQHDWLRFDVSSAEAWRWGCGLPACLGGPGPAPTFKP